MRNGEEALTKDLEQSGVTHITGRTRERGSSWFATSPIPGNSFARRKNRNRQRENTEKTENNIRKDRKRQQRKSNELAGQRNNREEEETRE